MRILVTGGAGFIGSHLVRRLVREDHEVTILDDFSSGRRDVIVHPSVSFVEGDVRDAEGVERIVGDMDFVFHLAAVVGVRRTLRQPWDTITTSAVGTVNVLRAALRKGCGCVVASSSSMYGKNVQVPLAEEDDVVLGNTHLGAWTYSYAKAAEEVLCRAAWQDFDQPVKVVRLFNVVGPGQGEHLGMVLPRFVGQALRGEPLVVYGDGGQTRTFMDVEDAIEGILHVWRQGDWGAAYNVGGTEEVRIVDLAHRVVAQLASSSPIEMLPFQLAYGRDYEETMRRKPDLRRLRALGYRPRYTLDQMIRRLADDQKEGGL